MLVSHLRQKALSRALVPALWTAYKKVVKEDSLRLLQSDDVIVVFQALCNTIHSEEGMEMMIQVALDINEIGKQLPQDAYEILVQQAIDHLPADQIKALLWQIQGRRRFFTEIVQFCESNAEIKRFYGLYSQLVTASFDIDGYSTYYQSRKERAENLGRTITQWIFVERINISPKVVEMLLTFLFNRHIFDQTFVTLSRLSKEGYKLSQMFYTSAIHQFGKAQEFDYMDMTLDMMRKQGFEPSVETYSAIIDAHSKAGNLRDAQRAYQDVLAAGLTPTETIFGPMVEAVGKMGDYDMTRQLVDQMNSSGVKSNQYTFSALLQSLAHETEKSAELFQELAKQIQPNTVNYNILIRTFQRNADLDGAFKVFRAMVVDHVKPDQYTFSSILSLFATRGDAEGAEEFWSEMVKVHMVVPNTHIYASMMHVYCTAEDMLSAQTVYRNMIQAGILPNEVVFGTLLAAYARHGDLTQMLSIYDAMRAEGLRPNSYIYSNLLFGLVQDGDMTAARRLYHNMEEDGYGQNVMAQTILLKGYADHGDFKEAQTIYKNMIESGLIPNYMTYAALMNAHAKRGEKRQVKVFLNKIIRTPGFVDLDGDTDILDAEESTELDMNKSHDRLDDLSSEQQQEQGQSEPWVTYPHQGTGHLSVTGTEQKPLKAAARPNPLMTFTPLMDSYAKEGNILATKKMFDLIKGRQLEPNTITYTILMDGFRRTGDVESVLNIWNELFNRFSTQWSSAKKAQHRLHPSPRVVEWIQDRLSTKAHKLQHILRQPISITLDSLCYSGRVLEAQSIWGQLECLGYNFDSANWNDYCVALARNGRVLEACQIIQDKLLTGFVSQKEVREEQSLSSSLSKKEEEEEEEEEEEAEEVEDGSSKRSKSSRKSNLEEQRPSSDQDTMSKADDSSSSNDTKLPASLFYPRSRTFAALADSLEQLLVVEGDQRKTRFEDYLSEPIMFTRNGALKGRKEMIESKLESYPEPYRELDADARHDLWSLVRTEYPKVLDALSEGMLVASKRMVAIATDADHATGKAILEPSNTDATTKTTTRQQRNSTVTYKEAAREAATAPKEFTPFRQWRRLQTVMKDMERKQFLEDRTQRINEA
ncbi:hypothetical protein BG004_006748 [Podila humilis]|nr:hypothetical protein BG004_006748 [Podila humilis]